MPSQELLKASSRTVAFLGGGTPQEVDRLVDEDLLPASFFSRISRRREYDLLGAAAALSFNLRWKSMLTREARKDYMAMLDAELLSTFRQRYEHSPSHDYSGLTSLIRRTTWVLVLRNLQIDLTAQMLEIGERINQLAALHDAIVCNPQIMSGAPVFKGTRLPIETVLASLDAGVPLSQLIEDHPQLSALRVQQARLYLELHPRAGRPRKMALTGEAVLTRKVLAPHARG